MSNKLSLRINLKRLEDKWPFRQCARLHQAVRHTVGTNIDPFLNVNAPTSI